MRPSHRRRIVVVGSGTRFLSGISVYTVRLAEALADAGVRASVLTMRQLLPTFLYPGKARVGTPLTDLGTPITGAHVRRHRLVVVAQPGGCRRLPAATATGHARARVVDRHGPPQLPGPGIAGSCTSAPGWSSSSTRSRTPGELRLPLVGRYSRLVGGAVIRLASGFTVHSEFDRELLARHWDLAGKPVAVLPHGPHDHYQAEGEPVAPLREAPADVCNVLFFGVIRPYKGLEDLVAAFDRLSSAEVQGYWLTVVGETWEGHTLPTEMIARSPYRDRITFVNRYVHDAELDGYLRGADAAVLPYRRSSLSGPLHVAMGYGLPIVMTDTGGNGEAAEGYAGILLMPVGDVEALTQRLRELPGLPWSHVRAPSLVDRAPPRHTSDSSMGWTRPVRPRRMPQPGSPPRTGPHDSRGCHDRGPGRPAVESGRVATAGVPCRVRPAGHLRRGHPGPIRGGHRAAGLVAWPAAHRGAHRRAADRHRRGPAGAAGPGGARRRGAVRGQGPGCAVVVRDAGRVPALGDPGRHRGQWSAVHGQQHPACQPVLPRAGDRRRTCWSGPASRRGRRACWWSASAEC